MQVIAIKTAVLILQLLFFVLLFSLKYSLINYTLHGVVLQSLPFFRLHMERIKNTYSAVKLLIKANLFNFNKCTYAFNLLTEKKKGLT